MPDAATALQILTAPPSSSSAPTSAAAPEDDLTGATVTFNDGPGTSTQTGTIAGRTRIGGFWLDNGGGVGPANVLSVTRPATPASSASSNPPPDLDSIDGKLSILTGNARATPPAAQGGTSQGKLSGPIANVGAGANDAITGLLGAPVDAATGVMNLVPRGINLLAGTNIPTMQNPVGGSDSLKGLLGYVGADPRNVAANDSLDRFARGTGTGIASMVAPFAAARTALGTASTEAPGIVNGLLNTLGNGSLTSNAAIGAGAGGAGAYAADQVPDAYKPYANLGGQLLGGGVVGGGSALLRLLGRGASDFAGSMLQPFGIGSKQTLGTDAEGAPITATQGQQRLAAQRIASNATGGQLGLQDQLDEGLANPQLVPGSEPTTFQATGNPGIGQLERTQATKNPDLFNQRRAEQNAARVGAIEGLSPATANPEAVGNLVNQRLADLDAQHDAAITAAKSNRAATVDAVGGQGSLGDYGRGMRSELGAASQAARDNESALWNAIDPAGNKAMAVDTVRQAANDIPASLSRSAKPPSGEEAAIYDAARRYGDVEPYREIKDLRSRTLAAIRAERVQGGDLLAMRRLQQFRETLDDAISGAVADTAKQESEAVAAGRMAPEDTMASKLQQQISGWYSGRDAEAIPATEAGGYAGANSRAVSAGRSSAAPRLAGTGEPAHGRPGTAPRDQSLPGQAPLAPNFGAPEAAAYRAAADATKARKATFGDGPVGDVLRQNPSGQDYRLSDYEVPAKFFRPGAASAADVDRYFAAVGDSPRARQILNDYMAFSLRRAAVDNEGQVNLGRYSSWLGSHAPALGRIPGAAERFQNLAAAQKAVDDASAHYQAERKSFQTSAAKHFLGDTDPVQAVDRVFRSPNPTIAMGQLSALVSHNPEAREGLKRAVVDYMRRTFEGTKPAGETGTAFLRSDALQKFIAKNQGALGWVFGSDGLNTIKAVASDLQRGNPARTKLAASPGTAQDLTGVARHAAESGEGHGNNLFGYVVALALEHSTGSLLTGLGGALGLKLGSYFRSQGLKTVDDLVTEAMLDPHLARILLTKISPQTREPILPRLGAQLQTLPAAGAINQGTRQ